MHADLLLIDEASGRAEAKRRHLRVTGTLGVLKSGAEQGLVNVPDLVERLKATSFYLDEALVNAVFDRVFVTHVINAHNVADLADSLDPAFPLLQSRWIPRKVEVYERAQPL